MRGWLGTGVLVLGVGVLGWWARGHDAARIEAGIAEAAATVMGSSVHGAVAMVSGRDIRAIGTADGPEERDALLAALDTLDGRRAVHDELVVLDRVSPFTMSLEKLADGTLRAAGHVPTEAARADVRRLAGDTADTLTLAAGAPAGWSDLARSGIMALGPTNSGTLEMVDGALILRGEVNTPIQQDEVLATLAGLPDGMATVELTLLDDGSPAEYTLDYDAGAGARLTGKLPVAVTAEAVAAALGLGSVAGEVRTAIMGEPGDLALPEALRAWLPRVETLRVTRGIAGATIEAGVATGVNPEAIRAEMQAELGKWATVSVTTAPATVAEGAERIHQLTGRRERLSGGYWLAIPDFAVGRETCQTASDTVLRTRSVNFVSGSDVLDAGAIGVLNEIASVVRECVVAGGLKAEIGGHTDNTGDSASNRRLSQLRAAAVRGALIDRGIPREAMVSRGYGAEQPVADNATEDGRAKNRRTTVTWSE
ncbi:OmpA family protein [Aliigemmobacter aestuarii]|uniref:OmpA family protein n=1 Tax=Aliigemmobacter aestuarii TaxID=1445661 RepID=UPI001454C031|nr:OmpA family protein [Gemmobacter aestuarii]